MAEKKLNGKMLVRYVCDICLQILNNEKAKKWCVVGIVFFTIAILAFSRGITLTYNMEMHPDERVFYQGTDNLLTSILYPGTEFIEVKEYPEGAYLYHLPFILIGRVLHYCGIVEYHARLWVRISSVCYFIGATLLGIRLLWKYFSRNLIPLSIYSLTMCFSVFFIEHSRYGVGDMISTFLLMLIIDLTAKACFSKKQFGFLMLASFFCGSLGAVKWPLVLFLAIPITVWLYGSRNQRKEKIICYLAILLLVFAVAFLAFSPKAATDWGYFFRAAKREVLVYAINGKAYESGGLLNHILQVTIYALLYSDFPFSILILSVGFFRMFQGKISLQFNQEDESQRKVSFLFIRILPTVCVVFFVYNLFVRMLVFRTYTPYFAISILYVSYYISLLLKNRNVFRVIIALLTGLMVIRGAWFIYIIHDDEKVQREIDLQLKAVIDTQWVKTTQIHPYLIPIDKNKLCNLHEIDMGAVEPFEGREIELQPGEMAITGGLEFGVGAPYILPVSHAKTFSQNDAWKTFKEINKPYWKWQLYPDYYYYLLGGWIRGGTLSTFTMPCASIYYRNGNSA